MAVTLTGTEQVYLVGTDGAGFPSGIFEPALISDVTSFTNVATGITASSTITLIGGTPLTKALNVVGTVGGANYAVTLPARSVGQCVIVVNNGANAASVFPPAAGVQIDAAGAGNAVILTNAKRCAYYYTSATTIISAQLGATSA